jgi:hypothetical protein
MHRAGHSSGVLPSGVRTLGLEVFAGRPVTLAVASLVATNLTDDSRLKIRMQRFRGVATRYLPNFLGWSGCSNDSTVL